MVAKIVVDGWTDSEDTLYSVSMYGTLFTLELYRGVMLCLSANVCKRVCVPIHKDLCSPANFLRLLTLLADTRVFSTVRVPDYKAARRKCFVVELCAGLRGPRTLGCFLFLGSGSIQCL